MATIRLFASIREAAGTRTASFDGATVAAVIEKASAEYGESFTVLLPTCQVWVNGEPAEGDHPVTDTDEVALLPPVSGG